MLMRGNSGVCHLVCVFNNWCCEQKVNLHQSHSCIVDSSRNCTCLLVHAITSDYASREPRHLQLIPLASLLWLIFFHPVTQGNVVSVFLQQSSNESLPPELSWGGLLLPVHEMDEDCPGQWEKIVVPFFFFFIAVRNMNVSNAVPVLMKINKNIKCVRKIITFKWKVGSL